MRLIVVGFGVVKVHPLVVGSRASRAAPDVTLEGPSVVIGAELGGLVLAVVGLELGGHSRVGI